MTEGLNELCIVILEDNAERRAAMAERLHDRLPQYPAQFFATAAECIDFLARRLPSVQAIALDHDLDVIPVSSRRTLDSGTGRDVAEFLATQRPVCPVLIHTTNTLAGDAMWDILQAAGWSVSRVVPYGDREWISEAWFPQLRTGMSEWTRRPARTSVSVT